DFPNATVIGTQAFRDCSRLTSADFPNATAIGTHAFRSCSQLTSVDFHSVTSIGTYAFQGCSRLNSIKLASSQVVTLGSANAFERTPIASGAGYIYVPDDQVDNYKITTNWVTYANQIKGISELEEAE
ncbi:MAG: leucine-rich repeat domain-containing protein, partial [Clostridia bacterium]|nr:leucine-rich repeat domain-containing protein [Clostridia bacterium]